MKEGWTRIPLGKAAGISAERILPASHAREQFDYVGLEHIQSHTGEVLPHAPTFGSEIKSTKNVFHLGDILYGKLRPYLNKVHLACSEGICSTDIFVLQPKRVAHTLSFMYAPQERGPHLSHGLQCVDCSGFLTVSGIKCDVGATRAKRPSGKNPQRKVNQ